MKYCKIVACLVVMLALFGCSGNLIERQALYITPMIDGVNLSEEALNHKPVFKSANEAIEWSINNGYNAASLINRTLDTLEPGGAKGKVQVGYQIGIPLLCLYEKENSKWKINELKVKSYIDLIINVERPVVIYLMSNHFDTQGPLPAELSKDLQNLMLLKDGEPPTDDYYGNLVIPFTLLTDESIPVNHYRFEALRYIGKEISGLPQNVKNRIIAITMAGEVHHMFSNFSNGSGEYDNFKVTDYSPRSIRGFQIWLEEKYDSIENLNTTIGSNFKSFADVLPPSKNIHYEQLNSFTEHYDAYAAGTVPISGWLWDPNSVIEKLVLYVDGIQIGEIKRGLHRLDVYQAVDEINNPNVGFRYDLDYREFPPGHHNAQVVAETEGKLYLIAQAEFTVINRNQGPLEPLQENPIKFSNLEELKEIKYWLDSPKPLTALYYNPLAYDWNTYRSYQVAEFLKYFWTVSKDAGLPADKLFSHQIYSKVNSSWNTDLFMEEESIGQGVPYQLGINLYGGATNSDAVRELLEERRTSEYGVPEFHVQQWKLPNVAMESLQAQYRDGAKFISPYYISIIPDSLKSQEEGNTLQMFSISPDNYLEGSNQLYEAILEFAKQ